MTAVLDTNVVIYLQKGLLAEDLPIGIYAISVITEMELRSFGGLSEDQLRRLKGRASPRAPVFSLQRREA